MTSIVVRNFGALPARCVYTVTLVICLLALTLTGCEEPYGKVGGADITFIYEDAAGIARVLDSWCGEWYSHYGNRKLDSYRVGKWKDRYTLLPPEKLALFPDFDIDRPGFRGAAASIGENDYFIFYDDTVYETTPGDGGNGGWGEGMVFRYMGIVRAVNIFQSPDSGSGAVIIEYLDGCYPTWDPDIPLTPLPFFGIYYRILNTDCIQMANAVVLENLYAGQKYYTETATLQEAVEKNNAENDGEFIAWGVVIPQDRE
jgi:hypothetical protein